MNRDDRSACMPLEIERLVPHGEPIRFVDRLLECTEDSAVAEAIVKAESVLAESDGTIDPVIFMELIAQTYAAFKGYMEGTEGKPVKRGFLVAVRDLAVTRCLAVGDRVTITVKTGTIFGAFAVIDGTVLRDGVPLASANLKLWMPEESISQ